MNVLAEVQGKSLVERARQAAAVAGQFADDVDREGRFPHEAVAAMKEARLLGIQVPVHLGGEGASIADIAEISSIISQECASSSMIFAMHHIKLSSEVEHGIGDAWHEGFMRRVADEQLLIASSTTEAGIGGNLRNSICGIEVEGDICRLTKEATVISYGEQADAILITSRAHPDAAMTDQVMTVFLKGQYTLEKTHDWDTMGMRGTRSEGFLFKGEAPKEQILPQPFAEIAAESMLAVCHILWSGVWYGIAVNAVARAQDFVRKAAKANPGSMPPGALRLAEVSSKLQLIKSNVIAGLQKYDEAKANPASLTSMGFLVAMNNIKLASSQGVLDVINHCMLIAGIAAYKNNTPYSLSRHLRDAHSAQIMISNDRILSNTSNLLLAHKQNTSLLG
ncbi:acyl-CoA dehydrogenase family protein [Rhizobium sp. L1K21]|uniref:acyl-CoA dehydrogenase family protein n=1 Tax=Rhizobium sp. L1K21 TaxID=2954933 RepID=UPI0020933D0D|nr:acyl-CoA dehydrogenase family protein [Rhizobium sp. L1K21]MCO6185296.1 acyl-CoA/acyl-ACP dehydrogenase [Rhizobium sp. L1K21]